MNYNLINEYHIAVPTAFYNDETLNIQDTLGHILYLQGVGVRSVLVCGSTGEQHSLTLQEKISMLNAIEKETRIKNDFEIIFGVASIRQKEAILLAENINSSTKISGVLLGFPPYILPSQKEAVIYVEKISDILDKPIIIYNNPKRTGFDISTDSLVEVFQKANIIGLKEAGDSTRIRDLRSAINKEIYIYAGGEIDLKQKIDLGFNRLSSIGGNLYPLEIEQWFKSLLNGFNQEFARQNELDKLFETSPLVYLKKEISEKEHLSMGISRSPLGN
ncbi:dihydrodipicolinate synthase family protein [Enterococcus crotali]|uniref:dihydrodipicolinate synthase family protein n=1 Tax=Enterococcus crotali TaxID=1453587 RepID=UPI00047178FA|nr:dihydrodipicolinate synthase family protein [Enterococcus crotali]